MHLSDVDEIAREHHFARTEAMSVLPELSEALASLDTWDAKLLDWGAAERAICHRLAVYLEDVVNKDLRDGDRWHVDCEYNLFGSNQKQEGVIESLRKSMPVQGINDGPGKEKIHSVYPDVIVHHRDTTTNLLLIEMKVLRPSTTRNEIEFDLRKLNVFQETGSGFEYGFAAFIVVAPRGVEVDGDTARITLYARSPDAANSTLTAAAKGLE